MRVLCLTALSVVADSSGWEMKRFWPELIGVHVGQAACARIIPRFFLVAYLLHIYRAAIRHILQNY